MLILEVVGLLPFACLCVKFADGFRQNFRVERPYHSGPNVEAILMIGTECLGLGVFNVNQQGFLELVLGGIDQVGPGEIPIMLQLILIGIPFRMEPPSP